MPAILEKRPTGTELAARSWQSLREALAAMPIFYVGCFLIYGLAVTLGAVMESAPPTQTLQHTRALVAIVAAVLSFATIAVAAFATHRFILIDDTVLEIGSHVLRFALWLMLLGIILAALDLVIILGRNAMPDSGLTFIIGGAIWIAKLVVAVHFALLFPSVAVGENGKGWCDRIATSWARMEGNFWLFVSGDIVALFPLLLALALGAMALMIFPWWVAQGAGSFFEAVRPGAVVVKIVMDLWDFPIMMVQAAIASWLYAWVSRQPGPALELPADAA